jgi:predicted Rossmann-fold nucleotide-binding protein
MILYNVNGFYNALIAQLDHAVQEGFLPPQHRAKLIVCHCIEEIYTTIKNLNQPSRFVV